jgi:membrane protease YdiL (CAAX protease family)
VFSVIAFIIPFAFVPRGVGSSISALMPFKRPEKGTLLPVVFMALGFCAFGNIAAERISHLFSIVGIDFSTYVSPTPNGLFEISFALLATAVTPALVEEFAMRNVVMQPLRKYGNVFAIIASALIFGVFHGTPSQIPFAFLCGLFLGYAVIATDSLWSGVIIHSIVNGLSCFYYVFFYFTDEDTADTIYGITCLVIAAIGFIALLVYISKYKEDFKRIVSKNGLEDYTLKQKLSKFIFAPAMLIAIIIFLIQAITMISFGSEVTM